MRVEVIRIMGSDLSVVNAARVSFAKVSEWDSIPHAGPTPGFLKYEDEKLSLLSFMWKIAYADGSLEVNEEKLIRRLADLIRIKDLLASENFLMKAAIT